MEGVGSVFLLDLLLGDIDTERQMRPSKCSVVLTLGEKKGIYQS